LPHCYQWTRVFFLPWAFLLFFPSIVFVAPAAKVIFIAIFIFDPPQPCRRPFPPGFRNTSRDCQQGVAFFGHHGTFGPLFASRVEFSNFNRVFFLRVRTKVVFSQELTRGTPSPKSNFLFGSNYPTGSFPFRKCHSLSSSNGFPISPP